MMNFWKTVGAVVVGNILTGLLGFLLFTIGLAGVLSDRSSDSDTIDIPEQIQL